LRPASAHASAQGWWEAWRNSNWSRPPALQAAPLPETAKTLGSRLLAVICRDATNLPQAMPDSARAWIEELLNQRKGNSAHQGEAGGTLITQQGEPISPRPTTCSINIRYGGDRRPLLRAWVVHFSKPLAACPVNGPDHPSWRQAISKPQPRLLVLLACLLVFRASKLWLGNTASPLALLVPPTLLLAQALGTTHRPGLAGLGQLVVAPTAHRLTREVRLIVAAVVARSPAVLGRGEAQSAPAGSRLAILLPVAALALQWLMLQDRGALAIGRTRLLPQRQRIGRGLC